MAYRDMKVTILGGRGMLGTDLSRACEDRGIETSVLDLPEFDITDIEQLRKVVSSEKIIINCAAYTNVEKAESQVDLAYRVNGEAVGRLGEIAKATGAYVLHISTDFVFDGRSTAPYLETDPTNPISVYGASKLAGERLLIQSRCQSCIIRLEWTYGAAGNNFIKKLLNTARAGKSLRVVDDQIGSPTATTEVAQAICDLLGREQLLQGIYHFAAGGYVSRYEMARFVFDRLGESVDLAACKTSDYVSAAARPLNSRFNCDKITSLLGRDIRPWQEPLADFMERL